jgi:hypothetical protein
MHLIDNCPGSHGTSSNVGHVNDKYSGLSDPTFLKAVRNTRAYLEIHKSDGISLGEGFIDFL